MRLPAKSNLLQIAVVLFFASVIAFVMGYQFATMHINEQAVALVKAEVTRLEKRALKGRTVTLTSFEHCPGEKGISVRVGYILEPAASGPAASTTSTSKPQADDPPRVRYFNLKKPVFGNWYIGYESDEQNYLRHAQKGNGPTRRF